jgi:hypothetical protein
MTMPGGRLTVYWLSNVELDLTMSLLASAPSANKGGSATCEFS